MSPENFTPEKEFRLLLLARHTLLWVTTGEERRVERAIVQAAAAAGYGTVLWDCATGAVDGKTGETVDVGEFFQNPTAVFDVARNQDRKLVWVMRDLDPFLQEPVITRGLKSLARDLQDVLPGEPERPDRRAAVVVLTPNGEVPLSLRGLATVVDWPLPARPEIEQAVRDVQGATLATIKGELSQVVDAAAGLTIQDTEDALAYSLAANRCIDPAQIAKRKKAVVSRERLLTWVDVDGFSLEAVGGIGGIKEWLRRRRMALTPEARAYGLPAPRGVFVCGPPGTGKSLTAKAVAASWGLPLLQMDMGSLKGGFVGQSEQNIRRALRTVEAVAPCVLWLDEIEKALAGSRGGGLDSGVSADQLGYLLTWLQEHQGTVFVVATSNDPVGIPPELTRPGRFDALFFYDLPTAAERLEILAAQTERDGRFIILSEDAATTGRWVEATDGFSGAEIAACVSEAMFTAFADGSRSMTAADLLQAAREIVPVSKSRKAEIDALRSWAQGRARSASSAISNQPARATGSRFAGLQSEEA